MTSIKINNSYGGAETSSVEDDLTLDEMLQLFSQCLKGAGYVFDGELEIIDEVGETHEYKKKK